MKRLPIAILALALAAAACGGDGAEPIFGTTSTETTASVGTAAATTEITGAPGTTAGPTTTGAPATTAAPGTTTAPTLGPPPPPPLVYLPDGIGIADFGDEPNGVIATVTGLLGVPTGDSGWIPGGGGPYGVCPGSEYRQVEYQGGDFVLRFTDAGYFAAEGVRQFYSYGWYGGAPGLTLGPPVSLDAGSTVQQILDAYPTAEVYPDDVLFGPTFRVTSGGWDQLWGTLTGTDPSDVIEVISGGVGCGE